MQKPGTEGVGTTTTDGVLDISNSDRLGFTEVELVQRVVNGVAKLIATEKQLEVGYSLTILSKI